MHGARLVLLLTYKVLRLACDGTMTPTNGWGGLLQVEDGPPTTATVPCHSGGSAGLGPLYLYCTSRVCVLPSSPISRMLCFTKTYLLLTLNSKLWHLVTHRAQKSGKGETMRMYRAQTPTCMAPGGLCL